MTLPLRLTSSRGLLIQTSSQIFAIPINAIDRIINIDPKEIISLEGRNAIRYNGRPITLVSLSDVLCLGASTYIYGTRMPAIVLKIAERCIAINVDAVLGEQDSGHD
jgi:two-component system chemotaxis sensor kinase CheA